MPTRTHKKTKNRASGVAHQNSLTVRRCRFHRKCAVYFGPYFESLSGIFILTGISNTCPDRRSRQVCSHGGPKKAARGPKNGRARASNSLLATAFRKNQSESLILQTPGAGFQLKNMKNIVVFLLYIDESPPYTVESPPYTAESPPYTEESPPYKEE